MYKNQTEGKAEVVAAGWRMESNAAGVIKPQDDFKKRLNGTKLFGEMDDLLFT